MEFVRFERHCDFYNVDGTIYLDMVFIIQDRYIPQHMSYKLSNNEFNPASVCAKVKVMISEGYRRSSGATPTKLTVDKIYRGLHKRPIFDFYKKLKGEFK